MTEENNEFYYAGKILGNEEEFSFFIKDFNDRYTTDKDFEYHLSYLERNMKANLFLLGKEVVQNFEMQNIMEEMIQFFIERIINQKQ